MTGPTESNDSLGLSEQTERTDPVVTVEGLTKRYGDVLAVEDISLTVDHGTVVGVLGPNGAGKTTLLKSMLGLVLPTEGQVTVEGVDVHADSRRAYRHMGAMLEGARNVYWRLTVRENLEFFARLAGRDVDAARERHDALLDALDLADRADTIVNELSRGMKQKVALAATLSRTVSVAFLDEPTLGLDVESSVELRRELRRMVDRESMTVLLSSHDMDTIQAVCDRVVVLSNGRVIADDPVDDLLDLFRTQAYEITVEGSMPTRLRTHLETEYGASDWRSLGDRNRRRFEAAVAGGERLHALTGDLIEADVDIVALDPVEPDLEEVYLRLTSDDASVVADDTSVATDDASRVGDDTASADDPEDGGSITAAEPQPSTERDQK